MIQILVIFTFGIVVGAVVMWFSKVRTSGKGPGLVARQADEKARNKKSIVELLETQTPLTNDHIQKLLGVSDATATRYLDELEKEGNIRQVGKTGKYVYYEKVQ